MEQHQNLKAEANSLEDIKPAKTAKQLYQECRKEYKLPNDIKKHRDYDWNIIREFYNWLKQINNDPKYLPNKKETDFLEEIMCAIILKQNSKIRLERYTMRDTIIAILTQRIDIRDSVLLPNDYSVIDSRMPLKIVSDDEAQRVYNLINPDGFKDWRLPLMPINNYYEYIHTPIDTENSVDEYQPQSEEEYSDIEFLQQFELDPTIEDEPIQYCYEIGGTRCIPKGDLQANKAPQKNGKTFFQVLLMGAALKGDYLGVKCLIKNPRILYCDTEQHPRNTRLIYRRVCQIAGIDGYVNHEQIKMLHLRLADNVEIIKKAIRLEIKYFRPDMVFIDGLVDCLVDFNDQKESKKVITELSRIALDYNCAIMNVLHTNPNDDTKMRGHAGTFLAQKASDVILCLKEKKEDGTTIFNVEQTDNRNDKDFSKFSFAIELRKDTRGQLLPVPVKSYVSLQEKESLDKLFRWALENNPMRKPDLRDKIMSDDCPYKVSKSTAYKKIKEAEEAGIIIDDDPVTYRLRYVGLDMPNEDGMPY